MESANAIEIVISAVQIGLAILVVAGMWRVFQKAGEAGWKAIIPFYNFFVGFKITGRSGWWFLTTLLPSIPVVYAQTQASSMQGWEGLGLVFITMFYFLALGLITLAVVAIYHYDMARSFGKGLGFALGLTFLPFVFWPILGFGAAEYIGPSADQPSN